MCTRACVCVMSPLLHVMTRLQTQDNMILAGRLISNLATFTAAWKPARRRPSRTEESQSSLSRLQLYETVSTKTPSRHCVDLSPLMMMMMMMIFMACWWIERRPAFFCSLLSSFANPHGRKPFVMSQRALSSEYPMCLPYGLRFWVLCYFFGKTNQQRNQTFHLGLTEPWIQWIN